ncbi:MAG: hypothetical protein V7459_11525 [Oceanicoccus sp.]
MISHLYFKSLAIFLALTLSSFQALANDDKDRAEINKSRQETLTRLYKEEADAKKAISKAYGYAVFSNVGVNVIFFSAGGGSGVAHNNKSGKDTYMKMASAGIGIGLGVKDFRAVFAFHTKDAFDNFVDKGWDFSGQADAAAKSGDKGGEGSAAGSVVNGVTVYQLTESGLALQATLQGTKYWKDDDLN